MLVNEEVAIVSCVVSRAKGGTVHGQDSCCFWPLRGSQSMQMQIINRLVSSQARIKARAYAPDSDIVASCWILVSGGSQTRRRRVVKMFSSHAV